MSKDEALKLSLEALHGFIPYLPLNDEAQCGRYDEAITAIKKALAQPKQEPVAWMYVNIDGECEQIEYGEPFDDPDTISLYTTPPQRTWVGLTEQDKMEISDKLGLMDVAWLDLMEAIEAKLKDKNHV